MVNQFGAHHAGFAGDDEPSVVDRHAVGRSVADQVHFSVVATDLDPRARFNVHGVAKALFTSAQPATPPWSSVVTVHEHDVPFRIDQQCTEGSSRAV